MIYYVRVFLMKVLLVVGIVFFILYNSFTISAKVDEFSQEEEIEIISPQLAFAGGSGTDSDPYLISTVAQLRNLQTDISLLSQNFKLANDLQFLSTSYSDSAVGWQPIGNSTHPFVGEFDGGGHVIQDLYINTGENGVGLFGNVSGTIKNVNLINANVTGNLNVGALVGWTIGAISNSHISGNITGIGIVGGIVGWSEGIIANSSITGNVTGKFVLGGVVGFSFDDVYNISASVNIEGEQYTGGLIGNNRGTATNLFGEIRVSGAFSTGGLVGYNNGNISDIHLEGIVHGTQYIGGVVGYNLANVTDSSWTGIINAMDTLGGIAGFSNGTIVNSTSRHDIVGTYNVGGLVGENKNGFIINCVTSGNLTAHSYYSGGLVGISTMGYIFNSSSNATISGTTIVGGLVGSNSGLIANSHADGNVSGIDLVGGFTGFNQFDIINTSATGYVFGNTSIGGGIGLNQGNVTLSFATGDVNGNFLIGGLVGQNSKGKIANSTASGSVTGMRNAGGLAGSNIEGTIINSYATGNVTVSGSFAGGLTGLNYYSIISNSFAEGDVTAERVSGGLVGKNHKGIIENANSTGNVVMKVDSGTFIGVDFLGNVTPTAPVGSIGRIELKPILTAIEDTSHLQGEIKTLSWIIENPSDTLIADIYQNGTISETMILNTSTTISHYLGGNLKPGIYNYTINIHDYLTNFANDTVFVRIIERPIIPASSLSQPEDVIYRLGETGNFIAWTIMNSNGSLAFTIYKDGNIVTGTSKLNSTEKIEQAVDELPTGTYNFKIVISTENGTVTSDSVLVTVIVAPEISNPPNIDITQGTSGALITWTITNREQVVNIEIYRNQELIASNLELTTASQVKQYLDGLTIGTYNYTVVVHISDGSKISDTVLVTVKTPIQLTQTSDRTDSSPATKSQSTTNATNITLMIYIGTIVTLFILGIFAKNKRKFTKLK